MADELLLWLWNSKVEVAGAIFGLLYICFSIRQHILTWPTGLLTSIFYCAVFFESGFYADMGLQVYYVIISIYGWYYWLRGGKQGSREETGMVPVRRLTPRVILNSTLVTMVIFFVLILILTNFTDSTIPVMDSFTTALSITATWMLARKYLEHWLIWIFVDLFSAGLYIYKDLWATVLLFFVYAAMALIGYRQWKKDLISTR
jgi:nicotinamide mononucleotide transporter